MDRLAIATHVGFILFACCCALVMGRFDGVVGYFEGLFFGWLLAVGLFTVGFRLFVWVVVIGRAIANTLRTFLRRHQ
jgi:hypothetical protein